MKETFLLYERNTRYVCEDELLSVQQWIRTVLI